MPRGLGCGIGFDFGLGLVSAPYSVKYQSNPGAAGRGGTGGGEGPCGGGRRGEGGGSGGVAGRSQHTTT